MKVARTTVPEITNLLADIARDQILAEAERIEVLLTEAVMLQDYDRLDHLAVIYLQGGTLGDATVASLWPEPAP